MLRAPAVDVLALVFWGTLLGGGLVHVSPREVSAQEEPSAAETDAQRRFDEAGRYEIRNGGGERLTLHPRPLMNWANPARTNNLGSIVVWESEGRPLVVGTVFTYEIREEVRWKLALHSLADGPLTASAPGGATIWSPQQAGVTWQMFPDPPAPAPSGNLRLVQMRRLARAFQVILTDREGKDSPLRLLGQPVWRYSSPAHGIADGAIFGWVVATDPEAFLLIELSEGGEWRYAFARFHFCGLRAALGEEPVWTAQAELEQAYNVAGQTEFQSRPYSSMRITPPE